MKKTSLLAALALLGALHGAALAQQTIKLGVISIEAGPLAVSAGAINDGAALAVERLNAGGGALGRKYELVIQGHDGPPAGAIAAATKLVRQQGVSFFTGISPSGNSLAVSAKLADLDALYLDATAASDDLTGKNCNPNYFRVGISDSSQVQVWRELAQRHGAKTFDLLMADIAAHDGFVRDATWLVRFVGNEFHGPVVCATIQGLRTGRWLGSIQNVGVIPEHRGHGLGRALVLRALEGFRHTGVQRVALEVTAANKPAVDLYRRLGFKHISTSYREVHTPQTSNELAATV